MRYIKFLFITLIVLIVSGCTKEYKLYISDNKFVEKFHMEINETNDYSYVLDGDFYPLHNDFEHKFQKSLKAKKGNKILDLEYSYTPDEFVNANSFNQCFDEREVLNKDEFYTIKLSKPNGCMFNENYSINIITNNKVIENNADKVNRNQYTWYVNNNDRDSFNLVIKVEKGTAKTVVEKYSIVIYIAIGLILFIIFIVGSIFVKKAKKNNKV